MNRPDPIMTVDEVAEYLNLHPLTIRRFARDSEIPIFSKIPFRGRVGRQWRLKRELLDKWIADQSAQNAGVLSEPE